MNHTCLIVESVSCAGEVKTTLNSLADSFKKCASVKALIQKPTAEELRDTEGALFYNLKLVD